ncbi:hypothetical protein CWB79_08125 [Pseudoalteromonas sp. S1649]|jgi:hypothetical protein|uniref:Uncharacterized protein n=1 Tax=Pseudoalteromonas lipolytica TaxID=570156 RepID=A0A0P7DT95_9GAMM|nr:hypothetical protein AOG27_06585 [Pseudoalteromonas lipolytica]TMP19900.1 hypothetical protein CWC02_07035 [Pseudoalteromonas sp. S2721]TMP49287.1 hypothetical protein CWB80_00890 [Pseudoalteromonas sp. S1650]TMP67596.1 hypothetical protein CWB79_08125 [Pseudoalteromonas sp. S1649]
MSRANSLYLVKQLLIILTLLYTINFICNEYLAWNSFIDCQNKCQTLGLNKGKIQKTVFSDDVTLCRCLDDSAYYVVLD